MNGPFAGRPSTSPSVKAAAMLIALFGLFVLATSFEPLRRLFFPKPLTPTRLLLLRLAGAVVFLGGLYMFLFLRLWI
jgi:hypothetical protein